MKIFPRAIISLLLAIPTAASANVVISELDLANSRVELVNIGTEMADLTSYRWCNRVTGSPFYPGVKASEVNAEFSTDSDLMMLPGQILVFDLTSSFLPAAGGELGLYLPAAVGGFGSRAAMVDYVNWGTSSGIRDSAAVGDPAIWVLDTAIDLSGAPAGDTIQLNVDAPGNAVEDYTIAPATVGVAQSVPSEPGEAARITRAGFVDGSTFFIEFEDDGNGTMKFTESTDMETHFTEIGARTKVTSPSPNRREFAVPFGVARMFFRIEKE